MTDGEEQQESPQSETIQDDSDVRELDDEDALFVLNEKYGTDYDNLDELLDDLDSQEQQSGFASDQIAGLLLNTNSRL